jgi:hypothetical protein
MPIFYDNLMANPQTWFEEILPFCKVAAEAGASWPSVLGRDSQEKSCFSREILSKHQVVFTEEQIEKMDHIIAKAGLATSLDAFSAF